MATFSLLVTSTLADSQSCYSAYQFARATLANGHQLKGIFFYQSGVHNANALQTTLNDETNALHLWQQLHNEFATPLFLCVTAANKRGILSEQDAQDAGLTQSNLAPEFTIAGLGELVSLCNDSDRVVQF